MPKPKPFDEETQERIRDLRRARVRSHVIASQLGVPLHKVENFIFRDKNKPERVYKFKPLEGLGTRKCLKCRNEFTVAFRGNFKCPECTKYQPSTPFDI